MIRIAFIIALASHTVMAQGADAHWPTAAKNGFGTSTTLNSKVWFTLANGVMTEVFYPRLDRPNVQTLQIQVHIGGRVETELEHTSHRLELPNSNSLTFRQVNTANSGQYTIKKTYITDPRQNTVLIDLEFDSRSDAQFAVYYDPSLNNSGMHDSAWAEGDALLAVDAGIASALIASCGFAGTKNQLLGSTETLERATGNVVQLATLKQKRCTLALGFGVSPLNASRAARLSLARRFETIKREYEAGWQRYVATLPRIAKHQHQFNMAAMVLKGLEDKTFRGASIASPSAPWGGGPNANNSGVTGYHSVWARDLYHVATAFDVIGDRVTARRLLDYVFRVQQRPDGSFPQNTFVDGSAIGESVQMDQVGLPLVLAHQLGRTDRRSWLRHIKPAADFIVRNGPRTEQDRWEEEFGFSPSSIAAQIAGLVCAAQIARMNDDRSSANTYLRTADNWVENVERWTATRTGFTARPYYIRITANIDPNDGEKTDINSSSLAVDERRLIDAGFLELVRLGVKDARDPLIVHSLTVVDQMIGVNTPVGQAWYRYNHDAYGETQDGGKYDGRTGIGRLWTLLTGERGEYEIAAGDVANARKRLDTMAGFANDAMMIPEQVWDLKTGPFRFGTGTGSATPLAWSMAQFIRLAMNIETGRNVETPKVVWERYVQSRANTRKER